MIEIRRKRGEIKSPWAKHLRPQELFIIDSQSVK